MLAPLLFLAHVVMQNVGPVLAGAPSPPVAVNADCTLWVPGKPVSVTLVPGQFTMSDCVVRNINVTIVATSFVTLTLERWDFDDGLLIVNAIVNDIQITVVNSTIRSPYGSALEMMLTNTKDPVHNINLNCIASNITALSSLTAHAFSLVQPPSASDLYTNLSMSTNHCSVLSVTSNAVSTFSVAASFFVNSLQSILNMTSICTGSTTTAIGSNIALSMGLFVGGPSVSITRTMFVANNCVISAQSNGSSAGAFSHVLYATPTLAIVSFQVTNGTRVFVSVAQCTDNACISAAVGVVAKVRVTLLNATLDCDQSIITSQLGFYLGAAALGFASPSAGQYTAVSIHARQCAVDVVVPTQTTTTLPSALAGVGFAAGDTLTIKQALIFVEQGTTVSVNSTEISSSSFVQSAISAVGISCVQGLVVTNVNVTVVESVIALNNVGFCTAACAGISTASTCPTHNVSLLAVSSVIAMQAGGINAALSIVAYSDLSPLDSVSITSRNCTITAACAAANSIDALSYSAAAVVSLVSIFSASTAGMATTFYSNFSLLAQESTLTALSRDSTWDGQRVVAIVSFTSMGCSIINAVIQAACSTIRASHLTELGRFVSEPVFTTATVGMAIRGTPTWAANVSLVAVNTTITVAVNVSVFSALVSYAIVEAILGVALFGAPTTIQNFSATAININVSASCFASSITTQQQPTILSAIVGVATDQPLTVKTSNFLVVSNSTIQLDVIANSVLSYALGLVGAASPRFPVFASNTSWLVMDSIAVANCSLLVPSVYASFGVVGVVGQSVLLNNSLLVAARCPLVQLTVALGGQPTSGTALVGAAATATGATFGGDSILLYQTNVVLTLTARATATMTVVSAIAGLVRAVPPLSAYNVVITVHDSAAIHTLGLTFVGGPISVVGPRVQLVTVGQGAASATAMPTNVTIVGRSALQSCTNLGLIVCGGGIVPSVTGPNSACCSNTSNSAALFVLPRVASDITDATAGVNLPVQCGDVQGPTTHLQATTRTVSLRHARTKTLEVKITTVPSSSSPPSNGSFKPTTPAARRTRTPVAGQHPPPQPSNVAKRSTSTSVAVHKRHASRTFSKRPRSLSHPKAVAAEKTNVVLSVNGVFSSVVGSAATAVIATGYGSSALGLALSQAGANKAPTTLRYLQTAICAVLNGDDTTFPSPNAYALIPGIPGVPPSTDDTANAASMIVSTCMLSFIVFVANCVVIRH